MRKEYPDRPFQKQDADREGCKKQRYILGGFSDSGINGGRRKVSHVDRRPPIGLFKWSVQVPCQRLTSVNFHVVMVNSFIYPAGDVNSADTSPL